MKIKALLALGIVLSTAGSVRAADATVVLSTSTPLPTPAPLQNPLESKLRMEDAVEANNPFGEWL